MSHLEAEIRRLLDQQALDDAQGNALRQAGQRDLEAVTAGNAAGPRTEARSTAVLEVLGYVGGALLLGAILFLGVAYWEQLTQTGRNLVAIGALVVPAAGGAALVATRARRELGLLLMALACFAAGFAYFTVFTETNHLGQEPPALWWQDTNVVSPAVILAASVFGLVLLRAGAFLVSGWVGAMVLVAVVVGTRWDIAVDAKTLSIAGGFLLTAIALAVIGRLLSRTLAWTLAGLSGWISALTVLYLEPGGEWYSLAVATVVAGALLVGFVLERRYLLAGLGCAVLLTLWPAALYQIFSSALGVALGLIAAGAVLITVVVVLSRRRPRTGAVLAV
jgi:hypothetical protein